MVGHGLAGGALQGNGHAHLQRGGLFSIRLCLAVALQGKLQVIDHFLAYGILEEQGNNNKEGILDIFDRVICWSETKETYTGLHHFPGVTEKLADGNQEGETEAADEHHEDATNIVNLEGGHSGGGLLGVLQTLAAALLLLPPLVFQQVQSA